MHLHCKSRLCLLLVLALGISSAVAQEPASPENPVRAGLGIMNRVVSESGTQIGAHRYEQLPREAAEFERGLERLTEGLSDSPPELRQRLGPLLAKARVASSAMAEAARSRNEAMIPVTHRQLAAAVQAINELLPPAQRRGPS